MFFGRGAPRFSRRFLRSADARNGPSSSIAPRSRLPPRAITPEVMNAPNEWPMITGPVFASNSPVASATSSASVP